MYLKLNKAQFNKRIFLSKEDEFSHDIRVSQLAFNWPSGCLSGVFLMVDSAILYLELFLSFVSIY